MVTTTSGKQATTGKSLPTACVHHRHRRRQKLCSSQQQPALPPPVAPLPPKRTAVSPGTKGSVPPAPPPRPRASTLLTHLLRKIGLRDLPVRRRRPRNSAPTPPPAPPRPQPLPGSRTSASFPLILGRLRGSSPLPRGTRKNTASWGGCCRRRWGTGGPRKSELFRRGAGDLGAAAPAVLLWCRGRSSESWPCSASAADGLAPVRVAFARQSKRGGIELVVGIASHRSLTRPRVNSKLNRSCILSASMSRPERASYSILSSEYKYYFVSRPRAICLMSREYKIRKGPFTA